MAYDLKFRVVIDTGKNRKQIVLISRDRDSAMLTACKLAERMGGCFLDIVTFELMQNKVT